MHCYYNQVHSTSPYHISRLKDLTRQHNSTGLLSWPPIQAQSWRLQCTWWEVRLGSELRTDCWRKEDLCTWGCLTGAPGAHTRLQSQILFYNAEVLFNSFSYLIITRLSVTHYCETIKRLFFYFKKYNESLYILTM